MSLAAEIKSFAKWTALLGILNFGLVLIVFGLMARENACSAHLVQTFMTAGCVLAFAGALSVGIGGLTSVAARITNWRRVRALRQERERLLAELATLEGMAQREISVTDRALDPPIGVRPRVSD
jgi:hypothetical protein